MIRYSPGKRHRLRLETLEQRQLLSADQPWIRPTDSDLLGDQFAQIESGTVFAGFDDRHGQEIWFNPPSYQTARMVSDTTDGPEGSSIDHLTAAGPYAYYTTEHFEAGSSSKRTVMSLWRTDGTEAGTVRLHWTVNGRIEQVVTLNEIVFAFVKQYDFINSRDASYIVSGDPMRPGAKIVWSDPIQTLVYGSQNDPLRISGDSVYFSTTTENSAGKDTRTFFRILDQQLESLGETELVDRLRHIHSVIPFGDRVLIARSGRSTIVSEVGRKELIDDLLLVERDGGIDSIFGVQQDPGRFRDLILIGESIVFSYHDAETEQSDLWLFHPQLDQPKMIGPIDRADLNLQTSVPLIRYAGALFAGFSQSETNLGFLGRFDLASETWTFSSQPTDLYSYGVVQVGGKLLFQHDFSSERIPLSVIDLETLTDQIITDYQRGGLADLVSVGDRGFLVHYETDSASDQYWKAVISSYDPKLGLREITRFAYEPGVRVNLHSTTQGQLFATFETLIRDQVLRYDPQINAFLPIASTEKFVDTKGYDSGKVHTLGRLDEDLFYFAKELPTGTAVYVSDGTELGTRPVFSLDDIAVEDGLSNLTIHGVYAASDGVYVVTRYRDEALPRRYAHDIWSISLDGEKRQVFRSQGEASFLMDVLGVVLDRLVYVRESLVDPGQKVYSARSPSSHRSDATVIADDIAVAISGGDLAAIQSGGKLFFYGYDTAIDPEETFPLRSQVVSSAFKFAHSRFVWETDGTPDGLRKLGPNEMPNRVQRFLESSSRRRLLGRGSDYWLISDGRDDQGRTQFLRWFDGEDSPHLFEIPGVQPNQRVPYVGDHLLYQVREDFKTKINRFHVPTGQVTTLAGLTNNTSQSSYPYIVSSNHHPFAVAKTYHPYIDYQDFATDGSRLVALSNDADSFLTSSFIDRNLLLDEGRIELPSGFVKLPSSLTQKIVVTSSNEQISLLAGDRIQFTSKSTDVVADLSHSGQEIVIDVDSLSAGHVKRIGLMQLAGTAKIRFVGTLLSDEEVRYVDTGGELLIMIAGIEITVGKDSPLTIVDEFFNPDRQFFTGSSDDHILLSRTDGMRQVQVTNQSGQWSVQVKNEFAANGPYQVLTGTGNDVVTMEQEFSERTPFGGSPEVEVIDSINGQDDLKVNLPSSYVPLRSDQDTVLYHVPLQQWVRFTVATGNRPLHHVVNPPDVNLDGNVTPFDALQVINFLARLAGSADGSTTGWNDFKPDVSGDGDTTPLDALLVINEIGRRMSSTSILTSAEAEDADAVVFVSLLAPSQDSDDRSEDAPIDADPRNVMSKQQAEVECGVPVEFVDESQTIPKSILSPSKNRNVNVVDSALGQFVSLMTEEASWAKSTSLSSTDTSRP